ncbi:MAG: TIM barrel protein [Rhodospirillaceae bacterium]|nr:TIM barrel protein [Rhodospirillaceae bacterium]
MRPRDQRDRACASEDNPRVCANLGAEQLRTYMRHAGSVTETIARTIADLRVAGPIFERAGVRLMLENHEDFTGAEMATILSAVDHPWVGVLYDYGNSMMVGEEPMTALAAMLPYVRSAHLKDHACRVSTAGERRIVGVPIGSGVLPIAEATRTLVAAGLDRIILSSVWGYQRRCAIGAATARGVKASSAWSSRRSTRCNDRGIPKTWRHEILCGWWSWNTRPWSRGRHGFAPCCVKSPSTSERARSSASKDACGPDVGTIVHCSVTGSDIGGRGVSDRRPARLVCILGTGRMGSNHLCRVLSCIPEIESRTEPFHPRYCYGLHRHELIELSRRAGASFELSNDNPAAVKIARRHPSHVLDCLSFLTAPEKRIASFKILADQLTLSQIERKIVGRPDVIVVFLRRRPIDAFISLMKATHLQEWRDVDTTGLRIEIDAAAFLSWWRTCANWFVRLEAECWYRNKPFHHLSYEDDIAIAPAETARRFCALLEPYGLGDFTLPDEAQITGFERQDRNAGPADRVSNWPEFQRRLEEIGGSDKTFAPFPHFRPHAGDRLRRWLFGHRRRDRQAVSARIERPAPRAMRGEYAVGPGRTR